MRREFHVQFRERPEVKFRRPTDIARHSLRAADRKIALRQKNFEVLSYLVENPDRLVTKEELLKAIWPDVVVTD
jgi:DNA-binding winged helix-turn-helix (wHTH) protein